MATQPIEIMGLPHPPREATSRGSTNKVWEMALDFGPGHSPHEERNETLSAHLTLSEEDYPALAAIWDNEDDTIFDSL